MKIIIEEIGDHIALSFTGKGKKSDRKEEFTGKEAAFLSKLFNL